MKITRWNSHFLLIFGLAFILFALTLSTPALALDPSKPNWRVFWANDDPLNSDNQFSNGLALIKNSALAPNLVGTSGTFAFGKPLAALILPHHAGLYYRETWSIAQNMQTPNDDDQNNVILDDFPYMGMIGWSNTYSAFNNHELTAFQILVGAVGRVALAERTQATAHRISGASRPKGWGNQLDNEPIINLYAMKKLKLYNQHLFDASVDLDAALGNFFSFAETALEFRLGHRPDGFAPMFIPMGHGIDTDARLSRAGQTYFYSSLIVRGTGFLFAMPREGNLLRRNNEWTRDNVLNPRDFVGQLVFGVHMERQNWGLHANLFLTTETVKKINGTTVKDPRNNYISINYEWQFE